MTGACVCQELFSLLQSYAALVPVRNIEWPTHASPEEIQGFLIDQLILSDYFHSYPPSASYQKSFWKWVITQIEDFGEEVRDEIYAYYLGFLQSSQTDAVSLAQPPPPSYVTYIWEDSCTSEKTGLRIAIDACRKCTLFESQTIIESGTTGLRTWTASFVLAEYIIQHHDDFAASRVLELGSGTGFLGTILAQLQAETYKLNQKTHPSLCLTDIVEKVLMRCKSNVSLPCNTVTPHPDLHFMTLDWFDALEEHRRDSVSSFFREYNADIILGADLVYDTSIMPALVATIQVALVVTPQNASKRAIIAATLRNKDTLGAFTDKVRETGLLIEEINVEKNVSSLNFVRSRPDVTGESRDSIKLFVIMNKAS